MASPWFRQSVTVTCKTKHGVCYKALEALCSSLHQSATSTFSLSNVSLFEQSDSKSCCFLSFLCLCKIKHLTNKLIYKEYRKVKTQEHKYFLWLELPKWLVCSGDGYSMMWQKASVVVIMSSFVIINCSCQCSVSARHAHQTGICSMNLKCLGHCTFTTSLSYMWTVCLVLIPCWGQLITTLLLLKPAEWQTEVEVFFSLTNSQETILQTARATN